MEGGARTIAAIFVLFSILLPLASAKNARSGLHIGFYDQSCPQAEKIVAEVVTEAYKKDPGVAAGFLRAFFHDCFVHGCDASLLLDTTPSGEETEKNSPANGKGLRGLEVIDEAKARLERECPGIVSCADTLAFATRDGSVLAGVPRYPMPGGRRDGLISRAKDVQTNVPPPSDPVQQMTQVFVKKGLTQEEMVVLIGAHSIGIAHCPTFAYRVTNFNNTIKVDPKLNAADAANIKSACLRPATQEDIAKTSLPFDINTPFKMDSIFYKHLVEGKGLIESDRAMAVDPQTRQIVERLAADEGKWLQQFGRAMSRLSAVDAKTGNEGEIRKQCRFVNSNNPGNVGKAEDLGKSGDVKDSGKSDNVEDQGQFGLAGDTGKSDNAEDQGKSSHAEHTGKSDNVEDQGKSGDAEDIGKPDNVEDQGKSADAEDIGKPDNAEDSDNHAESGDVVDSGNTSDSLTLF